jgi:hypothetical protein
MVFPFELSDKTADILPLSSKLHPAGLRGVHGILRCNGPQLHECCHALLALPGRWHRHFAYALSRYGAGGQREGQFVHGESGKDVSGVHRGKSDGG